jgi:hypothetical protein
MTVPATTRRAGPYNGNGSTTSFSFSFKTFASGDLQVTKTSTTGIESVLVKDSDYTVTLNVDQDTSPGGSITYPISGSALATGEKLTIVGDLEYEQTTDLLGGGAFNARVIEDTFDRTVIQIQQLEERQDRALTLPVSANASNQVPFPEPNKLIGWDSGGTALVNRSPSDFATVSAFADWRTDVFNGGLTTYTLTADPGSVHNTDVSIGGVTQTPGVDYTVSGTALVFSTATPVGTGNVVVRYGQAVPQGTPVSFQSVDVVQLGADPTGVSDSSAAFAAAWATIKTTGGSIVIRPGVYALGSQWALDIDTAAPHNYEIVGYGATIKSGPAVTGWAIRVYGSYNNHGLKIEGLQFDQRNNVNVNGCILAQGTSNLRIVKCSAELALNKPGWAAVQLEDLTPGNGDTGCFWTLIDGLTTRARTGVDLFVAQTTATTTLTSGSNLMTVAAVTGTIVVGYTVFDLAGAPAGGLGLLPVGTVVMAQVSGTPGGAGVYRLSSNALGSTTSDTVAFAKYADFGVRMAGAQNATKIVNCSFASVVDAVRLDPGSSTPALGWPSGDVGHPNGLRIERNDFEGVTNAIKVNTDSPAVIMPVGLMAKSNRVEASYSYFNVGSNTPFIADAATFTGSIAAGTNVLTVTGITGTIAAGTVVSGAGVLTPAIVQAYGTGGTTGTGGNGTYALSLTHAAAVPATAMTVSGVRRLPDHSTPPTLGPDYAVTGSSDNYIINPNEQIVYAAQSTYYADSFSQVGGPSDYTIIAEGAGKNLVVRNLSWQSGWNTAHLVLGQQHYWSDQSGNFRMKTGAPLYDTDGAVVGLQGVPTSAPTMGNLFVNPWFNLYGSNPTTGVWGVSGGPPQGCTTTPVGVVWSATPPSPCPNNPTGQAARIQSIGTTVSNGLILSLDSAQFTNGDTASCGMWVLSPNLSTAKAVVYATDGAGATAVLGSNTVANTWQFIRWSQPLTTKANAVVYVASASGATFTATVPYGSNIMTVTGVTGTIAAGATLIGGPTITGLDIHPLGASITIQAYGTSGTTGTGGAGTYALSSVLTREVTAQVMNTVTGFVTNTVVWAGAFHMTPGAFAPSVVEDSFAQQNYAYQQTQTGGITSPNFADALGYKGLPVNSQSAAYGLQLTDQGKAIVHPIGDNNPRTFTIPANGSIPFPVGTTITFVNMINTVTIAITTDTMYLAGAGTTGSRTLAAYGMATAVKVTSTSWIISGNGLT